MLRICGLWRLLERNFQNNNNLLAVKVGALKLYWNFSKVSISILLNFMWVTILLNIVVKFFSNSMKKKLFKLGWEKSRKVSQFSKYLFNRTTT